MADDEAYFAIHGSNASGEESARIVGVFVILWLT